MEELIDEVIENLENQTAEVINALHACREGHPLSCGDRAKDFYNAAFMASGRVKKDLIVKLNHAGLNLNAN